MLTLKELKKVVKVAGMTKRVPSEKALEKEEIVVKEILSGECDITVYANGYVLYRENGKKTIFPPGMSAWCCTVLSLWLKH